MYKGLIPSVLVFLILLILPFLWQEKLTEDEAILSAKTAHLTIISAHDKHTREEFERAFRLYYQEKFKRDVQFDWRDVGGTADAMRFIDDRYAANFRTFYQEHYPDEWDSILAASFSSTKPATAKEKLGRERFLASDVGIGIDIFWGGGSFDQQKNANKGYAVDAGVQQRHPEWFNSGLIPQTFSGETIYDEQGRFYGACLASFGICYNPQRYQEMGLEPPQQWSDLAKRELMGKVVLGDPTKSGSVTKCYEMLIQQIMQEQFQKTNSLDIAWVEAMGLLKQLVGNSMMITDSAGEIPRTVSSGNGAVGICIDYYGFSEAQWAGDERLVYVLPRGGSSISADPIQLLRGAPNEAVAKEFIDFVLSEDGQKLWSFRLGSAGGPKVHELRRPPVRRTMYSSPNVENMIDPGYNPYLASGDFEYDPQLTGRIFSLLRVVIRCVMLDVSDDLTLAWQAILAAGGPTKVPEAYAAFIAMPFAYSEATEMANKLYADGKNWSNADIAAMRREWTVFAQNQYKLSVKLAGEGK